MENGIMSPGVENLIGLLANCDNAEAAASFTEDFKNKSLRYGDLKAAVADTLVELTSDFIAKKADLMSRSKEIDDLLQEQSAKARAITGETMRAVRDLTGLPQIK